MIRVLTILTLVFLPTRAFAQANTPRFSIQSPANISTGVIPRDPIGRPCTDIEAAARAQTINKDMLDHIVSMINHCAKPIKLEVCYANTDHCILVDLKAYKRVDTILGAMRGVKYFRYVIKYK